MINSSTPDLPISYRWMGWRRWWTRACCGRKSGPDGEPRFTMLETIREYALERLAASGRADDAAAARGPFLALAETAEPELQGREQHAVAGAAGGGARQPARGAEVDVAGWRCGDRSPPSHRARRTEIGTGLWGGIGYWGEGWRWLAQCWRSATHSRWGSAGGRCCLSRCRGMLDGDTPLASPAPTRRLWRSCARPAIDPVWPTCSLTRAAAPGMRATLHGAMPLLEVALALYQELGDHSILRPSTA